MCSINQVADYFIRKADMAAGDIITHLKLQKLVYYAQGWHLALNNQPLFKEELEAWAHGPVCPKLYQRFKGKSWNPILPEETKTSIDGISRPTQKFLDEVWEAYGQFTAKRLEEMTHTEEPWINAWKKRTSSRSHKTISYNALKKYFLTLKK